MVGRGLARHSLKQSQNNLKLKYVSYRNAAITAGTAEDAEHKPHGSPELMAKFGR